MARAYCGGHAGTTPGQPEVDNAEHPDVGPLARLGDATLAAQRLGEVADQLIGHFVDQARRSGATWSAIGEHVLLGVLCDTRGAGAKILGEFGITEQRARGWLAEAIDEILTARADASGTSPGRP